MSCELLAANEQLIALFLADDQHLHDLFVRVNVEQNTIVAMHSQFTLRDRIVTQSFHVPCFRQRVASEPFNGCLQQGPTKFPSKPLRVPNRLLADLDRPRHCSFILEIDLSLFPLPATLTVVADVIWILSKMDLSLFLLLFFFRR